jgi:hypothetical protein
MHSLGDRLIRLQPEMTDKNFILIQNDVSEDEGQKMRGSISQRGRGVTRQTG